ncbi:hypothetical protein ACFW04_006889 [Cataglyphis niger]
MNGDTFHEWLKNILPSLEDNTVIVMDNIPYHFVKLEKLPNLTELCKLFHYKKNEFDKYDLNIGIILLDMLKMKKKKWEMDYTADSMVDRISPLIINVTGETDSETSDNDY